MIKLDAIHQLNISDSSTLWTYSENLLTFWKWILLQFVEPLSYHKFKRCCPTCRWGLADRWLTWKWNIFQILWSLIFSPTTHIEWKLHPFLSCFARKVVRRASPWVEGHKMLKFSPSDSFYPIQWNSKVLERQEVNKYSAFSSIMCPFHHQQQLDPNLKRSC